MKDPLLVQISLVDQMGDCEPIETVTSRLTPAVDVDSCSFETIDRRRTAVEVEYSVMLEEHGTERIVGDIAATFRMVYEGVGKLAPAEKRKFATTRGTQDSWLSWKTYMEANLAWMGLPPVRLPATAPEPLIELALEAYDITLEKKVNAKAKTRVKTP